MRVVDRCDLELELVRQANELIKVDGLVAVHVELDLASDDFGEGFEFEVFGEGVLVVERGERVSDERGEMQAERSEGYED